MHIPPNCGAGVRNPPQGVGGSLKTELGEIPETPNFLVFKIYFFEG
jgi:hypothetical protein